MTSAVVLNEGRHVPVGATCYPDVAFFITAEGHGVSCACCVTSHCATTSDDIKYDVDFAASVSFNKHADEC